ncbi:MAG: hypothetical protein OIN88_13425 [Candidatus Methanoperedens sp.]|nr:hypothetical protein [Candidatus Methanoperedens sp.]MCZ7358539.1 hypothetical protein [Candidatus Methanoperedens sp.]HLB69441.1 hypothetical protein [Candidatus Methanoperedens sp.]
MGFEPINKKPGDLIKSDEWNKMIDELVELRKYIDNMTRSVTLTSLASPAGTSYSLSKEVPDDFNYDRDVMGLITRQYYVGAKETGEICTFGINDFADIIYYWSGAARGDSDALKITLEYVDGTTFVSDKLFIHEWSKLRPKGSKNPYVEYLQSPNQRLWYRYAIENPNSDKEIRYITFEDTSPESAVRIGNVLHYVTRIKQLSIKKK